MYVVNMCFSILTKNVCQTQKDLPPDRPHHGRFDIALEQVGFGIRNRSSGQWFGILDNISLTVPSGKKVSKSAKRNSRNTKSHVL